MTPPLPEVPLEEGCSDIVEKLIGRVKHAPLYIADVSFMIIQTTGEFYSQHAVATFGDR